MFGELYMIIDVGIVFFEWMRFKCCFGVVLSSELGDLFWFFVLGDL